MNHVFAVVRLHFVNTRSAFVVPGIVMAGILAVNLLLWIIIFATVSDPHAVRDNLNYSGSSAYIFVYMFVWAAQTIARTWPFAQGFGVSRRNFAAGTAISYVLLSVAWGIILSLFAGLETLTNGWGIGGRMFNAVYFGDGSWYGHFAIYVAYALLAFFVGAMFSAIYSRWRGIGIAVSLVLVGVVGAAAVEASAHNRFNAIIAALSLRSSELALVMSSLLVALIAAIVGYLVLRRITVRN